MPIQSIPGPTSEKLPEPTWPGFPTTSSEFITLVAHYYRGEIARMGGWRDRIDRTSNWAITVVGAMLSVSLSTPTAHHGVIFFAMVLVLFLLVIESRRYRFFDVYRARVRSLERHYYAQVFSAAAQVESDWMRILSNHLRAKTSSPEKKIEPPEGGPVVRIRGADRLRQRRRLAQSQSFRRWH